MMTEWMAFMDETGDHSLKIIDPSYPFFGLLVLICRRKEYLERICREANLLKHRHFGHEGVILRSYDIRKQQREFRVLAVPGRKQAFLADISVFVQEAPFTLFFIGIDKEKHLAQYGKVAENPYHLAMSMVLERLAYVCDEKGITRLPILAEARGKNEDTALQLEFYRYLAEGTEYKTAEDFKKCGLSLVFATKKKNVIGLQLADLCAHPLGRHIVSGYGGQDYQIVEQKLHRRYGRCYGLKIFP